MKKILAVLCVLTICASIFAACDSGSSKPAEEPAKTVEEKPADTATETKTEEQPQTKTDGELVIYGIYKAGDQTWFIDEGAAAQKAVEAQGGKFVFVDARMNAEEYLKAIDNAIANKASGVITCIPDQQLSQAAVDKLTEAGIPVVAADDALQTEDGTKIAPWVGIDGYVIGEANGEWMANYAKEKGLDKDSEAAVLIMTMDTVSSCVPRTDGERAKFTELLPDYDTSKIYQADYNGETDKGFNAAQATFTAHPEVKKWMIMTANEEGAIGAVRALEDAGLDADSAVIGLGAYLAKDEFKKPEGSAMKAATYFSSDAVGAGSVSVMMDIINGKTPPMETAVKAIVVTPENYEDVMGEYAK